MANYVPEKTREEVIELLLNRRNITSNNCWEYTGSLNEHGYGIIKLAKGGHNWRVHRLAMWCWGGYNGEDLICHINECNNRKCFNPEHLYVGTHQSNARDMVDNGGNDGMYKKETHCPNGHEYTPENTGKRWKGYRYSRYCITCMRATSLRAYYNRKERNV